MLKPLCTWHKEERFRKKGRMSLLNAFHMKFPIIKPQLSPTPTNLEQSFLKNHLEVFWTGGLFSTDLIAGWQDAGFLQRCHQTPQSKALSHRATAGKDSYVDVKSHHNIWEVGFELEKRVHFVKGLILRVEVAICISAGYYFMNNVISSFWWWGWGKGRSFDGC